MYVRLAFAVAAHLEPEILILDEVLAVGDAEFRRKCLGKMRDVTSQGRTVLFVSHDMGSLASVCTSGLMLDHGRVVTQGSIQEVLQSYRLSGRTEIGGLKRSFEGPLKSVAVENISINGQTLVSSSAVSSQDDIEVEIIGIASEAVKDFQFGFALYHEGARVMSVTEEPSLLAEGPFRARVKIPSETLRPGLFSISAGGKRVTGDDWIWGSDLATIEIVPSWSGSYQQQNIGIFNSIGVIDRL
jgi:lipopolysaccharide transport system ATP-binding protein